MNIQPITQLLFKQPQLQDVDDTVLQNLIDKYPYFSVARFLQLKKKQHENNTATSVEMNTAALHFNNVQWLHWLLQQHEIADIETIHIKEETISLHVHHEVADKATESITEKVNDTDVPEENETETEEITPFTIKLNLPKFENPVKGAQAQTIVQPQDEQLAFEPYHTIDYFASQGIKLSAKIEPNDQLGRQLKSFTDWLKVMRKLPESSIEKLADENGNEKIVAMAEHSIESKEIITEAMAEILAKQGMQHKSIDIYQKLSLLNPAKSHYFATKIQDLKQK